MKGMTNTPWGVSTTEFDELLAVVNKMKSSYSFTFTVAGWQLSGGKYIQTIPASQFTIDDSPIIGYARPDGVDYKAFYKGTALIDKIETGNGTLTATCVGNVAPSVNIGIITKGV